MVKIRNQEGVLLIELMLSLSLGMILLGTLIGMYMMIKKNYHYHEAFIEIQDAMRVSGLLLQNDIENAGFKGCYRDKISGYPPIEQANSKALILNEPAQKPLILAKKFAIPKTYPLRTGEKILLTDCKNYQWVTVSQFISISKALNAIHFKEPIHLSFPLIFIPVAKIAYTINHDNELQRRDLLASRYIPMGAIDGVVRMDYQIMRMNHQNQGIEISLLIKSDSNAYSSPTKFIYQGQVNEATDLKMYKEIHFYVALRNQYEY